MSRLHLPKLMSARRSRQLKNARRGIQLKKPEQIEKMRVAGRLVREVHDLCRQMCRPGVTTMEIDLAAASLINSRGAKNLFLNYPTYEPGEGFPSNLCISVNEVVVHGIAGDYALKEGDVVGIDCGVQVDGWCGDAATTIPVGQIEPRVQALLDTTRECLEIAVAHMRPNRRWSQIARLMQNHAEGRGYGVVRGFVGHGIGDTMHQEPKVPNFVDRELLKNDIQLRPGMTLAVEPMCNLGTRETETLADQWTVVTADGEPSAHFEHTIAITEDGCDVLTDGR